MAKKGGSQYVCQQCGNVQAKWSGRCSNCGAWNSFVEETTPDSKTAVARAKPLQATAPASIKTGPARNRLISKISEIDQVVGGGIVPGSMLLLAGEPGIGKSTLLLQLAEAIAKTKSVLYVSGEESLQQLKLRADRLKVTSKNLGLATTTSSDEVAASIAEGEYDLVIVDSVQTMTTDQVSSSAGTVSQITATTQLLQQVAKQSHSAVLLVGHVTKQGNIAGPKILEHLVDVVLYLEGERFGGFKILRGVKNRFGSTDEIGIFAMGERGLIPVTNPSAAFLEERAGGDGSVVFAAVEGTRALLVEVQALVNPSPFGYPKRTASGFDLNRLNLLLAVLGKRAGLNLGAQDVYVNVVGGMKLAEPAADLAVALAIASAARSKPLLDKTVVFGEVGLSGEIRSISQADKRLNEAKKLGFKAAIGPKHSSSSFVKPAKTLIDAIKLGLRESA